MLKRLLSVLLTAMVLLTTLTACSFDFLKKDKGNKKEPGKDAEQTTAAPSATTATTSAFPIYYVTADPTLNVRSEPKVDSTRLGIEIFTACKKCGLVSACEVIFRAADGGEGLREIISSLLDSLALSRDGEIHSAVRVLAFGQETVNAFRRLQIGGVLFDHVIRLGKRPERAPLKPDAFFLAVDISLFVKAGENTALFSVDGVSQPEREDLFNEFFSVIHRFEAFL